MSLRIALFYDRESWVLESIARAIAIHAGTTGELRFSISAAADSRTALARACAGHDIVHYLSPGDFYRLGAATALPCVVTVHHVASRIERRLSKLAPNADLITVTNVHCGDRLRQVPTFRGAPEFPLLPLGIDTDVFRPYDDGRQRLLALTGLPPEACLLGLSAKSDSNEDDRKGFDRTWDLLRLLQRERPGVARLVLFGPGPEQEGGWRPELIPEDVRSSVCLPGFLPFESLPALYSGLDFYTCLSRIEGGPNPVIECMACGVPTMSTRVGIVEELITHDRTGWLLENDTINMQAFALIDQWRAGGIDRATIGAAARRRVVETRSWQSLAKPDRYLSIYTEAIARYRARTVRSRAEKWIRLKLAALRG